MSNVTPGCGCDIGTMNLVSARRTSEGVQFHRERDAFVNVDAESAKQMLRVKKHNIMERGSEVFVVGDSALRLAQMMGTECRRPLKDGLISPGEDEALDVLGTLVKTVLGDPVVEKEVCYFSIPASPIDTSRDVIYHKGIFTNMVGQCGYTAVPSNEAMAIIFAETAEEDFSGIGISIGAGLCNVALASEAVAGMTFSVSRAGDWIDNGVARAVGMTSAQVCARKERGLDLANITGDDRVEEALALYYRELITYCLDNISDEFKKRAKSITLPKPIPIVVAGGTSMVTGFLEFFREVFEKRRSRFPIEISEIRQAQDPLHAVAQGLMTQAVLEQEG